MTCYSIGLAASLLGVSVSTLRRWESEEKLIPYYRTPGGHRRYSLEQLNLLMDENKPVGKTVCYARVSSHDQKADLARQAERLDEWCQSQCIEEPIIIEDLGSGLNYKKKGLRKLLRMIAAGEVSHLVVMHKDRLLRFGADLLFELCQLKGIKVTVVEAVEAKSHEEQLTADVIELMTVFSARLYGARSHKNRKNKNQLLAA